MYMQMIPMDFYGYGYSVATDRLFQMEMSKRTGQGTVAEALGPDYLQYDIATHSRFDPENIKQQLAALSPEDRAILKVMPQVLISALKRF